MEVPSGMVVTYGELARAVGLKNGQRKIGQIMRTNPFPVIIPCHRVVRSDGNIGGYAFGIERKVSMLYEEGIEIPNGAGTRDRTEDASLEGSSFTTKLCPHK